MTQLSSTPALQTLKPQEIPFDHPQSTCSFDQARKPLVATRGALAVFGLDTILRCLVQLQRLADEHHGIDYLQVFTDPSKAEALWFIEDGDGGAITALLPSEY
jgi:hypothetical protein